MLYSENILVEYADTLLTLGEAPEDIVDLIRRFRVAGEHVRIESFHVRHYPEDPDDIAFLLCAINGAATHLITSDHHLLDINHLHADSRSAGRAIFWHSSQPSPNGTRPTGGSGR